MSQQCPIAVVVATRNEEKLGRAVLSLRQQTHQPHAVYLMDDGTWKRDSSRALRAARHELRQFVPHVQYVRSTAAAGDPGAMRAQAFADVLGRTDIAVVAFLDSDDEHGVHHLAHIAAAYQESGHAAHVLFPGGLTYVHPDGREELRPLTLPWRHQAAEDVTDTLVDAWVEFARHGAAFAVTVEALRRFGVAATLTVHDEWVVMYPSWAMAGANFVQTKAHAGESYRYFQHPPDQMHARRRAEHAQTRPRTVRAVLTGGFNNP